MTKKRPIPPYQGVNDPPIEGELDAAARSLEPGTYVRLLLCRAEKALHALRAQVDKDAAARKFAEATSGAILAKLDERKAILAALVALRNTIDDPAVSDPEGLRALAVADFVIAHTED
jgi:hypothetical protein